jgi:hypothetical protein
MHVNHEAKLTLGSGRNICVLPTPIAATVHGDSNQDDKPLIPLDILVPLQRVHQLVLYFTALWHRCNPLILS